MSNLIVLISLFMTIVLPGIIFIGSIILIILKIIERKKEKRNEDFDKYDKY